MREIKFRGHNGTKWLYSTEISGVPCFDEVHYFMPNEDNELTQEYIGNWDSVSYVGEYTGLKDINGTEIYEGDIVEVTRKHWNNCNKEYLEKTTKELGIIELFKNLQMSLKVKEEGYNLYQPLLWILEDDSEIKIIGNIYENSELLERE